MSSFASRFPRLAEWRGWLPAAALALFMFAALIALGGDRGYFYRGGGFHDWNPARTLTIAKNLSPEHNFILARGVRLNADGGFEYDFYGRFPIGGFVLTRLAILPFGDSLADELFATRILAMLMFCGAAALAFLAISRIAGSRRVAFAATSLAFSGFYAVYYADALFNEGVMDLFGAALVFHGMAVFVQEGRFRQLLVKTCAALLLGWHVYALLLPFIFLGLGGEALALLRSAAAANEKAKAARAAIISLARSRYAALAAVSILFGSALFAFNFAGQYMADGGETEFARLPLFDSVMRRFGQTEAYEGYVELEWGNFLRRQLYRAGVVSAPYAAVRAVGYDFPAHEPTVTPLAPSLLGLSAACAALAALALARGRRLLLATAVLFGFCWAIPMRYNTFAPGHSFESLPFIFLALALFALALIGARRLLGGRAVLGIGAAAALVFALSVFLVGQRDRDPTEAQRAKAEMAEFDAIREIAREKRVATFQYDSLSNLRKYYLQGTYRADPLENVCDPRRADFAVSPRRLENPRPLIPENRFAFLYEAPALTELCRAERRLLESSPPAARSVFDVYYEADSLRYLKEPCEPSDYEAQFFIHAHPADPNAPIPWTLRAGPPDSVMRFDGACLLTMESPRYLTSALQTGQRASDGERLWEVSIIPPLNAEARAFYEKAYQDTAASGEPAARSGGFDLYLNRDLDTLSYLKAPCGEDDARGRFFLSVHPVNVEDLPADRREVGHESLNFTFAPPAGVVFDGKCMATRRLPDYDIAIIETGQWVPGGERLWGAEVVVGR